MLHQKVSIENSNFKALSVKNLADLDVDTVMKEIRSKLINSMYFFNNLIPTKIFENSKALAPNLL